MINIGNILKRAWQILWTYKVLWVFAFLLAISGGAGSSGGGGGGSSGYSANMSDRSHSGPFFSGGDTPQWWNEVEAWGEQNIVPLFATEEKAIQSAIWIGVGILLFAIVMGLLLALVRYPSETAVIRMVDEHETTGVKYRFKQGWKLGWTRRAFRVWLVDLIIGAPAAGIVLSLVGLISYFALTLARQAEARVVPGVVIGIIFVSLFLMLFVLVMIVVSLVRNYIVRYAAIEGNGVWESFRLGWKMFKTQLKHTVIMALVMFGVGIAFGIASILVMILLIPAYAVLTIPGALVAAIPGGLAYFITSLFSAEVLPWVIAAAVALPLFFTVVFAPLLLLGGLFAVYTSNVWTLMFRQFKAAAVPPILTAGGTEPPPLAPVLEIPQV